jgi:hypothetical protein
MRLTFLYDPPAAGKLTIGRIVAMAEGETLFVALTVAEAEQDRRIDHAAHAEFGKLRSAALLRTLRPAMAACEARMPAPVATIGTSMIAPEAAAEAVIRAVAG